jgi:hypothetical protein
MSYIDGVFVNLVISCTWCSEIVLSNMPSSLDSFSVKWGHILQMVWTCIVVLVCYCFRVNGAKTDSAIKLTPGQHWTLCEEVERS